MATVRRSVSAAFTRVIIVLGATLAGLLTAEVIARLVAPYPMTLGAMGQINGVIAPQPNAHGRHFVPGVYDTTFSFSSQRFRGPQLYTPEPGPQTVRIAALGASFTFGSGANDAESYPFQLQSNLQDRSRRNGWNHNIEVINAGIPGSVTAEQALWYENWVRRFHPQLVILNVGCAVDHLTGLFLADGSGAVTPRPAMQVQEAAKETLVVRTLAERLPGYAFLAQHSEFFNLFRMAEGRVISRRRDTALSAGPELTDPTSVGEELENAELALEAGEVVWLKERVEQSGARFAVAVLPCRENVYPSDSRWANLIRREYPLVVNRLRVTTSKEHIPFTELSSAIRDRAKQSQPLYYDGRFETHPTPAGYHAIADTIADFLLDRALVPTSGSIPPFPGEQVPSNSRSGSSIASRGDAINFQTRGR